MALLNSEFSSTIATALADRVRPGGSAVEQLEMLYLLLFSRPPSPSEREIATHLLSEASLRDLCLALINTNEAIYLD